MQSRSRLGQPKHLQIIEANRTDARSGVDDWMILELAPNRCARAGHRPTCSVYCVRHWLKVNAAQFSLLMLINAFVGGMIGLERTVVLLSATQELHLLLNTIAVGFIISLGDREGLH